MAKSNVVLGIELLDDEARLALAENGENGLTLLATQRVAAGEDMSRALRGLARRPSVVVCAVPLENGAIRILSLPPSTEDNLERVVGMEAESVLPLPTEEMALSHQVLGMTEQSRLEVLLAACRLPVVQRALARVNCAPWVSSSVTLSAAALLNAVQQVRGSGREDVCAVLCVEAQGSELLVLDHTRIVTAQSIPIGCGANPAAAEAAGARPAEAATANGPDARGGDGAVGVLAAAAPPWISTLSQQVRYALQALSYERGAPVERLYLCGSGSGAPNADWRISEQLDLPVTLLAPEPARGADQAAFAVAYGCAVQAAGAAQLTLNLTPARITVAREVEQRRQNVLSWGALASAVVLATGLVFGAAVYQKQQALAAAESRLRALGMAAPAPPIPAADLKAVATAVDEASEARVRPADLLALLSAQLPTGAWLAELTYNSETGAVVRGYSTSSGGAQAAQNRMLRQQVFDEVLLDYVTEEQIGDVPVWGFQLTCRLRPKEQPRRGQRPAAGTRR